MLELLREHGMQAEGIDLDAAMVERCRAKGHAATVADAVEYMESAPAGSLGAVFAAQVIEHLPYPALVRFLRGAQTALRPSGRLIVETVNPHAPQAFKHFLDRSNSSAPAAPRDGDRALPPDRLRERVHLASARERRSESRPA
jgi:2-polyprenyl-3-methyl-5-hydroxy-6-metoxy-1,4-benzoquinol methylase